MKRTITISFLTYLFTTINISAQKTISGFNHIESVATDGKYLYVADIGKELAPFAKDQDGKIIVLDSNGKIIKPSFTTEQLNAPKGLAIDNGVLYTNDIDRIIAFDLKTGKKLYEINFENETSFLNDIAVWDKNTLYVSATDKSKLFKVDLIHKTFSEVKIDTTIPGINGLFCYKKGSELYVNGFGTDNKPNGILGYVNLQNTKPLCTESAEVCFTRD
jgi:outer membrane protein assembly factor BamB